MQNFLLNLNMICFTSNVVEFKNSCRHTFVNQFSNENFDVLMNIKIGLIQWEENRLQKKAVIAIISLKRKAENTDLMLIIQMELINTNCIN